MMFAYKASQVVGIVSGLVGIILISVGLGNLADPWVYTMLACLILTLWFRTHVHKNVRAYKGVTIRYVQERPGVWSSHICGHECRLIFNAVWHSVKICLDNFGVRRLTVEDTKRVLLLEHEADRQKINKLSLEAFEVMLDALQEQSGAVIISASVLNFSERRTRRLQDRVDAVQRRPQWAYKLIERELTLCQTIFGRWALRWPVRSGEGKRAIVPGIVVWRRIDPLPKLEDYGLVATNPALLPDTGEWKIAHQGSLDQTSQTVD